MKQIGTLPSETCLELCIQVGKRLYKWFERRLERAALTPVQLQVLVALAKGKGLAMGDLKDQLCCVGSNVTAVVARMAEAGLVERQADQRDRRVRLVRITRRGRHLLAEATETPRCCPEMAELLTAQEWRRLQRLLIKVRTGLEARV